MSDPRPLTRKELASFLPDPRAIRTFEKLFQEVPQGITDVDVDASMAISSSNISKSLSYKALSRASSNGVLLWLSI